MHYIWTSVAPAGLKCQSHILRLCRICTMYLSWLDQNLSHAQSDQSEENCPSPHASDISHILSPSNKGLCSFKQGSSVLKLVFALYLLHFW